MRVVHLANHCYLGNGNAHAAVDVACAQAKAGHEVYFCSEGGDFVEILEQNGVRHIILRQNYRKPWTLLPSLLKLLGIISTKKPNVIHAHMMAGAALGFLASIVTNTPLVTTVHNSFDKHAILMGLGDKVIAVSQAVAKQMETRGVSRKKLATVLNGTLNAARTQGCSMAPVHLKRPSLTTVCGLHPRKGVNYLIEAFDQISQVNADVHFYLIGEGPNEDEYKAQAQRLTAVDRIHFLGIQRNPLPYLRETDIFVLASLQDPCPLVIPEARAAGCAIVATAVDGIPEMLSVGNAGTAVPPKDAGALAEAVCTLLQSPEMLAAQKLASQREIAYFDVKRVMEETVDVYRLAAAGRGQVL